MALLRRKICLNKLKLEKSLNQTQVCVNVCVNGKNIQNSYRQKIKGNVVNFFGESIEIQINSGLLLLKVMECGPKGKQTVVNQFVIKYQEIQSQKKQHFNSKKNNFILSWSCQPIQDSQSQCMDISYTDCQMSQINHYIYSDEMLQKKIKKCFSTSSGQSTQQTNFKSTFSQIGY